ncbi:hypothetical protein IU431_06690 [Nocardia otitidiscaviarum]|uniref:hypothetical protein n=1 Tax=Nocardia otitidiscaviarum TaxID=1823 RepID=UPI0004A6F6C8|nr:hypothetical protein [Nocardia otitidiscaviarum]MBF6483844.1 hypothetical protein [Nocardia otitidiscaviarum]
MPVSSYKMGPGSLILGPVGTELDISCQITKATLEPEFDKEDDLNTLCGDVLPGEETTTWKLSGEAVQDIAEGGLVDWTWANQGTQQPFKFVPSTAAAAEFTGTIVVRPLSVGGDVKTRPTSEFEFPVVGSPVRTPTP